MTTTVTGLLLAGLAPAGMAASLAAREPDQGMPARPLCGSHLGRHHARQSAAPMVLLDGLRPDVRPAPHRPPRYRLRAGNLRHHQAQAPQDRCAGSHQRPPHQDRHGVGLSGRPRLGTCRDPSRHRSHRPCLARMTRPAAARPSRHQPIGPTENPKKTNHNASLDATDLHGSSTPAIKRDQTRLIPCAIH